MNAKQFVQEAIKNGYDGTYKSKEWIKNNVSELDYIFQTKEYKDCKGMNHTCMPILLKGSKYNELEESALSLAWFINNERESKKEKEQKILRYKNAGFVKIENDEKLHNKKIEFVIDRSTEMFGGVIKYEGRLYWSDIDQRLMAMQKRHRRNGCWIDDDSIYIKILK